MTITEDGELILSELITKNKQIEEFHKWLEDHDKYDPYNVKEILEAYRKMFHIQLENNMQITEEGDELVMRMSLRDGEQIFYGLRSLSRSINKSNWHTLRTFCFELRQTMKRLGIVKG